MAPAENNMGGTATIGWCLGMENTLIPTRSWAYNYRGHLCIVILPFLLLN